MNTNPDETKLALWLEDELPEEEFAAFEAWATCQPEQIAARAQIRRWRELIASAIPAGEEPPYPDFFNARVARAIRMQAPQSAALAQHRSGWKSLLMPLAACAGMVLAFWLGTQTKPATPEVVVVEGAPRAIPVEPFVYTPEIGVQAERFTSSNASATVIVLNGVAAIPDTLDFSKTTSQHDERTIESTAAIESETNDPPDP
jgi:anti-sigma factor RsiW